MTSGWIETESRSTGTGSESIEYDASVGWIMMSELLTSSALRTWR